MKDEDLISVKTRILTIKLEFFKYKGNLFYVKGEKLDFRINHGTEKISFRKLSNIGEINNMTANIREEIIKLLEKEV